MILHFIFAYVHFYEGSRILTKPSGIFSALVQKNPRNVYDAPVIGLFSIGFRGKIPVQLHRLTL
jgi:hypothetical protein